MEILGLVSVPGWLVVLLLLLLTVYLYGRHKHSYFQAIGIHTMPGTFMLGDMPIVFKKGFNYINADVVKEHGKVFGIYMGNRPSLVVSDTELIKEITVKQFNKFTDRQSFGPLHERWYSAVSAAEGSHWKFLRTTLSPTFSSGKLRNMCPLIELCLKTLRTNIEEEVREHPDGFDIVPLFNGLTMDVICSTGFGIQVNAQTELNNTFVQHARKLIEVNPNNVFVLIINALLPDLGFILKLFPTNVVPNETYEYLKSATMSLFAARKEAGSTHKDLLQLMINAHKGETDSSNEDGYTFEDFKRRGLTDEEVLVNSMVFMAAGYDTTASALSWCVYDLVVHPEVQDKLIKEIDAELGESAPSYDNVCKLQYLDMVMNETLRVHPPGTRAAREVVEDTEINGIPFKKGMAVTIPILALHYMPEYWESPNEYKPDRFAPENQDKINQYAFMPFGKGPRNCIAMRLAQLEFKMTMVSLLQKFRLAKTDKLQVPMPYKINGICRPSNPVMIKALPRNMKVSD